MPTKRQNQSDERELISQIKSGLADYELQYVPGAWENFQKKEQKKKRGLVFWMGGLSAAATLLVIGFGIFSYLNRGNKLSGEKAQLVNYKTTVPQISRTVKKSDGVVQETPKAAVKTIEDDTQESTPVKTINGSILMGDQIAIVAPDSQKDAYVKEFKAAVIDPITTVEKVADKTGPVTLEEFLANETIRNQASSTVVQAGKSNKWDLGVVVAPSVGNNKRLNMGYGMSMAYNVSEKIALGSGLSYNEMTASKDIAMVNAYSSSNTAFANDSKNLESVNTVVTGIDIPLELKYKISNRLYANAGVSAFAVISQKNNNIYQQSRVVQASSISPNGDKQPQSFLVSEKVTEAASPSETKQTGIIGFYNFSFGYKQKITKDKSIGIEPFLKVPMKDISKENLRLMGTGLKIKFEF
ncbi:MAG: hypothetical protein V4687_13355 [Bacteroidota bacterium]